MRAARCIPTARAMPSSCLRSEASITKIKNMRSIPAATENCPKRTKRVEKISPVVSAWSMASFFTGSASRPFAERTGLISSALDRRSLVGDEDLVYPTLLPDKLLQPLERHDYRGLGGGVGSALVDPAYLQLGRV